MGRKVKNRTGERYKNIQGCCFIITKYFTRLNCTIQFEDGFIKENVKYDNIKTGQVKNPNIPSVFGIGYEGVGKYSFINHPKIRVKWKSVLERCYCPKWHKNKPTYKDCIVAESWHNFQNFAQWFEENYKEGFELDKDILLKGNKVYCSNLCCFVPAEINTLFRSNIKNYNFLKIKKLTEKYKNQISKACYQALIKNKYENKQLRTN